MFYLDALENQRKQLRRDLNKYYHLLRDLRKSHFLFRCFNSWKQAVSFFGLLKWNDPLNDQFLIPIIRQAKQNEDAGWNVVITLLFWHVLISLFKRLSKFDLDWPDELWQRIYCSFIDSVRNIDLKTENYPIAARIFRKVKDSVRDSYRSDWRCQKRLLNIDDDPFKNIIGEDPLIEARTCERILYFQDLHRKGIISEIDCHLIVGNLIYNETLQDSAFDLGLTYEYAKKRRQRALKKIRDYQENLSPNRKSKSLL